VWRSRLCAHAFRCGQAHPNLLRNGNLDKNALSKTHDTLSSKEHIGSRLHEAAASPPPVAQTHPCPWACFNQHKRPRSPLDAFCHSSTTRVLTPRSYHFFLLLTITISTIVLWFRLHGHIFVVTRHQVTKAPEKITTELWSKPRAQSFTINNEQ
jgi:hypothetical protein